MANFFLLRHGNNDWVGKTLAGRLPDVHLNTEGRAQAARAAAWLAKRTIHRIVSSPLDRTLETAGPLAKALSLPVDRDESFSEVLFGEWEGKSIPGLDRDARWRYFNTFRSGTSAPGGELASEMQSRFVAAMTRLHGAHPEETIVIVSHADPIRAALAYFLGMPIDFMTRLEIRPASVSEVELKDWGPRVLSLNRTFEAHS
jgi:broad specificity phosphatase PhoE